ncbi:cilia- and flagella-associated protein 141-like [Physella acuta]|uniref:cilia- and flagella-associated protein 141-like n=1 Tax=Physella acuta TaxID=109671 RepID=UPI0027DBCA46|nr:cilia- and flagella-associated protein 141-like [Physella acuta]
MSKETNLRYELPPKSTKLKQQYMRNIQCQDEVIDQGVVQKEIDRKQILEKWVDESNNKMQAKQRAKDQKNLIIEMKLAGRASILVRQRALALKLEADQKMYEEELAKVGKAFHKQRM